MNPRDRTPAQLLQGSSEIVVATTPETIWNILSDAARLPEWMSIVRRTDGHRESVGSVRHCDVVFGGRSGQVTERCVEAADGRIAWVLDADTLGFSRMLRDFGFAFILSDQRDGSTRVRNETYFRTNGLLARVMAAVMLRRKFAEVRQQALQNLRSLAEADHTYRKSPVSGRGDVLTT